MKQSLDDVQKLQRHDKYGCNEDDPDEPLSPFYRELCRPPAPKSISGREDQSELQVYVVREKKNEQRGNGIDKDNKYLVHIHLDKVKSHQMIQCGHKEEPDTCLNESSIEPDSKHGRINEPAPSLLRTGFLRSLICSGQQNGDDNPDQDICQDLLEEFIADPGGDNGPCYGARQGENSQPQAHLKVMVLFLSKGYDPGNVLEEQRDAVGSIGKGAVQPQKDEGGQGDSGTSTGHDIHETGNGADCKEKRYLQEFFHYPRAFLNQGVGNKTSSKNYVHHCLREKSNNRYPFW